MDGSCFHSVVQVGSSFLINQPCCGWCCLQWLVQVGCWCRSFNGSSAAESSVVVAQAAESSVAGAVAQAAEPSVAGAG